MPAPADAVVDDEHVYRRIPLAWAPDPKLLPVWNSFRPREDDDRGLSVYLASLVSPKEILARDPPPNPGKPYSIYRLRVGTIRQIQGGDGVGNLDVIPDPIPANAAHALVPQMNYRAYSNPASKNQVIECAFALCRIAERVA